MRLRFSVRNQRTRLFSESETQRVPFLSTHNDFALKKDIPRTEGGGGSEGKEEVTGVSNLYTATGVSTKSFR